MNEAALAQLGVGARMFARCYAILVEAMMSEGVPEPIAREEARHAAMQAAFWIPEDDPEPWER